MIDRGLKMTVGFPLFAVFTLNRSIGLSLVWPARVMIRSPSTSAPLNDHRARKTAA